MQPTEAETHFYEMLQMTCNLLQEDLPEPSQATVARELEQAIQDGPEAINRWLHQTHHATPDATFVKISMLQHQARHEHVRRHGFAVITAEAINRLKKILGDLPLVEQGRLLDVPGDLVVRAHGTAGRRDRWASAAARRSAAGWERSRGCGRRLSNVARPW